MNKPLSPLILSLSLLVVLGVGCVAEREPQTNQAAANTIQEPSAHTAASDQQVLIGRFADPDVVRMDDGTWRLYFGTEPEVPGNQLEIYSASSTDGVVWTLHDQPILSRASFPDVVRLSDGRLRLSFQRAGELYSATSADGITFAIDDGVRIAKTADESGGIGDSATIRLPDGTYLMVFRSAVSGRYRPTSINSTINALVAASSADGLTWTRGQTVVDGRSSTFDGFVSGPDLFYDPEGVLHLRFWSSGSADRQPAHGQYDMVSDDNGLSWSQPASFNDDILGGDPTYAYQGGDLLMYYTVLTKGIYLRQW